MSALGWAGAGSGLAHVTSSPAPARTPSKLRSPPRRRSLLPAPCSRNPSPAPGGDRRAPGAARVPGAGGGEQSSAGFAGAGGEEEEEPMVCRKPRGCGESVRQPRPALPGEPSGGSPGWQQPVTVLQAVPAHLSPQVSLTRRLLRRPRGRTGRHAIELAANPLLAELRCGRAPEKGVAPSPRVTRAARGQPRRPSRPFVTSLAAMVLPGAVGGSRWGMTAESYAGKARVTRRC